MIKILDFNTWLVPLLSHYPEARAKKLIKIINQDKFDFIFLQEVTSASIREQIIKGCPAFQPAYSNPLVLNDGLLTLSSWNIINQEFVPFKNCFHLLYPLSTIDLAAKKGFLVTQVESNSQKMVLINTHFNTAYELGHGIENKTVTKIHTGQVKAIFNYIDVNHFKNLPIILGGDFNILPQSKPHSLIVKRFIDPFSNKKTPFTKDKKNCFWPLVVPFGSPNNGYRIDYLFLSKNHNWRKINLQLFLNKKYFLSQQKHHLSDHYALKLTLKNN